VLSVGASDWRCRSAAAPPGRHQRHCVLDVDAVTRGILALLDGLLLQRIEAGDAYRPADLERRATAIVELLLAGSPEPNPTA
jgi:hypothetical protein